MGTVLSFFRASSRALIGTTRELGGADDATTGGQSQTGAIDKSAVSQTGAGATQATVQQSKEELPKCFVEGDLANWKRWTPTRIKESRLTPEQRVKFQGHVDLIFSEDTIMGQRVGFDPNDVAEVMDEVREYLESEPMLIEDLPFDITVVADLHGQLYDLDRVFFENEKDGKPGWENMKYLFLGNYVDRGRQSLEIVMALFCLKMLYPDRIFLLRGNHEFMTVNRGDGPRSFIDEFGDRYKIETAADLYIIVNSTFCYLSVAAIIGNVYFCAHAGISPSGFSRHQMRGLTKPFIHSTDDVLVHDLVWSDPAIGITGFTFNKERQTSVFYGYHALCHALHCMEVDVVIRGHTKLLTGYEVFNKTLYSLFTATAVDVPNDGAFAVIDKEGKISLRIMKVDPERVEWEKLLREDQQPDDTAIIDGCDGNKTGMLTHI